MIGQKPRQNSPAKTETADLTALVDVFFLVLVFFLLTAHRPLETLKIDLPSANGGETRELSETLILTLFADDRWAVDGKLFNDWLKVKQAVRRELHNHAGLQVRLAGDRNASLAKLITAFTFLQEAGLPSARIIIQPLTSGEKP